MYIDFWGVDCGPCLFEIEKYVPKLHEAYDNDVVFLNICVDSNEKEWKEGITKNKVAGINLLAEGWDKNPVAKSYNISSIPHYVIINKNGTIENKNASPPSELIRNLKNNELNTTIKKPTD